MSYKIKLVSQSGKSKIVSVPPAMTMDQVSTMAREFLGCPNNKDSDISLYMGNNKAKDKRLDWTNDPNGLVCDWIPKQSTVHCAMNQPPSDDDNNNKGGNKEPVSNAAAGQKRNPAAIDLLDDDDSDSDDEVIEVVAVTKKPRREDDTKKETLRSKPAGTKTNGLTTKSAANNNNNNNNNKSATTWSLKQSRNGTNLLNFNVATYNIWFDLQTHPQERMIALAKALFDQNTAETPLLFVGFQEVTRELWATLKPLLARKGYSVLCQDLSIIPYGCAMAVLQTTDAKGGKLEVLSHGWQPYQDTIMGRGFLHARVQLPHSTQQVLFTTTHLESFVGSHDGRPPYTGARERKLQIRELEAFCIDRQKQFPDLSLALISGDLNWDDDRVQSKPADDVLAGPDGVLTTGWKDTWFSVRDKRRQAVADRNGKVKKKDEPQCYTYDAKENPMLGGNLRRRFDRILLRQTLKGDAQLELQIGNVELIGKDALPGLKRTKVSSWNGRVTTKEVPVLPSDHYGYVVTLNTDYN